MLVIESKMFRKNDDPLGEYRELLIYQEGIGVHFFQLWQAIGFIRDPDGMQFNRREQLFRAGSEYQIRQVFAERRKGLCDEGFVECEYAPSE